MIAATRHQGVVYLKAFDTEAWKAQCRDRENNSFQDHATFWGHNFEQHITSGAVTSSQSLPVQHY
ncbi:hypothetical protein HPB48_000963 [Haemaphysalis longicornis]|uniref:Uncharacterized protein n=1 Tax=Haemaphysalis longicornis TaxID=44386 RepID=A0A9J6H5D1_HAELO|nr:hypothetical protein HPB48_000963 [Haemaphysalis longicornis]